MILTISMTTTYWSCRLCNSITGYPWHRNDHNDRPWLTRWLSPQTIAMILMAPRQPSRPSSVARPNASPPHPTPPYSSSWIPPLHPQKIFQKEILTIIAHGRRQSRRDGTVGGGHHQLHKYKWKLVEEQSSKGFLDNFQECFGIHL